MLENNLKKLRKQRGLTLTALSKESGISRNTLSYYELGKTDMGVNKLIKVANCLQVTISEIFDENVEVNLKVKNKVSVLGVKQVKNFVGMTVDEALSELLSISALSMGEKIKLIRKQRHMTLLEFGKKVKELSRSDLKITKSLVNGWEKGRNKPDVAIQCVICALGGITFEELNE
ncbi:helix-turn-helix domain-containing protein [Pediococcus pentosaceus]|nr:helix-turn-helix domain-containing protein [Pediococcus pentosaceus]